MRALIYLHEILNNGLNTEQMGMFVSSDDADETVKVMFGENAQVIAGQVENNTSYIYDYYQQMEIGADVLINDGSYDGYIRLYKIED